VNPEEIKSTPLISLKGAILSEKLIELEEGILVMVEVSEEEARPISGGAADRVASSFDRIKPILKSACKPVAEVFRELNREMEVDQAEVTVKVHVTP
jgi:hypothetical protein